MKAHFLGVTRHATNEGASAPGVLGLRGLLLGRPEVGGLVDGFELYWGESV